MTELTEMVKAATTFLTFVAALIGIPIALRTYYKGKLEIQKLQAEIKAFEAKSDTTNKALGENSRSPLSRKYKQLENYQLNYNTLSLAYRCFSIITLSIILFSLIAPAFRSSLPLRIADGGWPTGDLSDIIFRAMYGILPHLFGILAGAAYRHQLVKTRTWFSSVRSSNQVPSLKKYVMVSGMGFSAGFVVLILLNFAELHSYNYISAYGLFLPPMILLNDALFGILSAALALYFCLYLDLPSTNVKRETLAILSSVFILSISAIAWVLFSIGYHYEFRGGLDGAVWSNAILIMVFALALTVALRIFTPRSETKRSNSARS